MAHRQEREPASTEVTEVAPNVLRMQLPITMPGLGHVNMYALIDSDGVALVDPGLPGPFTWKAIQDRLRKADLEPRHVHTIVVTHSHPDHFGGAARFVKEYGTKVIAHRSFRFGVAEGLVDPQPEVSVADLDDGASERAHEDPTGPPASEASHHGHQHHHTPPAMRHSPWGGARPGPPLRARVRMRVMRMLGNSMFVPPVTHPVEQGDLLDLAGREMFVLHTPGHTADHFCLHDPEQGLFVAGDHVLPTITPHISGTSSSRDPLLSFFYSLDRVGELPGIRLALPAHGHPFTDLKKRTAEIKQHHFERLERLREISREFGRPASVEEFSKRLFRPRSWGGMAESETYAHLEHLRHAREAESHRDSRGVLQYVTR
jgi:glyoxylase-like metal-dependent hydrolase (beta-lactamase superfamily II)